MTSLDVTAPTLLTYNALQKLNVLPVTHLILRFLCQLAVCSIGGIGTVCVLAEERERGAERTILLAGASRTSIAVGKTLACIVVSEFVALVCAFGVLRDIALACETALFILFTTLPVAFVSVALGMRLNDQPRASSWGTPILFIGVIAAAMKTVLDISPWALPTGAAPELIDRFVFGNMAPTVSPTITCVIGAVYCLLALGVLIQSVRKQDSNESTLSNKQLNPSSKSTSS